MSKKYPLAMTEASKNAVRGKRKKASLKKMKPEAFLDRSRPLEMGEGDRAIVNEFKKQMQRGDPMGPLKLYDNGTEDGRHRATAAEELGLPSVPVVDYRDAKKHGGALLEDKFPTSYLPNVGRQVMADGGPVMNVPTHLPIGGDPEAFFRRLALYSYAVAPLAPGRHKYAAGGQPTPPAPYVTGMTPEGYPIQPTNVSQYGNIAKPYVQSFTPEGYASPFPSGGQAPASPAAGQQNPWMSFLRNLFGGGGGGNSFGFQSFANMFGGRSGYQEGGSPEIDAGVSYASPEVEDALRVARRVQMPPIDIAAAPPARHTMLPDIDVGRPRPEWGSASDVVRYRLDTGEKQLPQYDREAVEAWKEGAKGLGHMAAYGIPYVGPALGAYDLATAAGEVASPQFREALKSGDKLSTAATLGSLGLSTLFPGGKMAKAAIAGAGALMAPEEAKATMFGEAAKMSPQIRAGLEAAKRALVGGAKPAETWLEHGWAPDPSGKMVSELSDEAARLIPEGLARFRGGEELTLGELLSHPELYEKYPTSFSTRVSPYVRPIEERGEYNSIRDAIRSNVKLSDRDLLNNLLHEHQHRVQHIERMSPGTNPDIMIGPEELARPFIDQRAAIRGAMELQRIMRENPRMNEIDALMHAKEQGIPIASGALGQVRSPYESLVEEMKKADAEIEDIRATVPTKQDQYLRSLGEWTARMPGERLGMTGAERRAAFPYAEDYPVIVRPQSPTIIKNVRNPKWMRERDKALEIARKLQESPLPARESGGVVKALKTLGKLLPEGSGYKSVPGKPGVVALPDFGRVEARPVPEIESAASKYMRSIGRPGEHEVSSFAPFNPAFAEKVAGAFEAMKHNPGDPAVRRAYDALADETMAQYRAAKDTGIDFRFLKPGEKDPYAASPALGYEDIVNRGRLVVFPTEQGFGSTGGLRADNPLLRRAGRVGDKETAVINDAFRVIHDLYGHFGPGNPFFRAPGEERAFQLHSKMFSPEALPAATAETRGQNSWLNYGPYGERNRGAFGENTIFADQKIGRLPEWTSAPAPAQGEDVDEYVRSLIGKAEGGSVEGYAGGGRPTLDAIRAAIEAAERAMAPASRISPEERMLVMHQLSPNSLEKIQRLGSLPAPSLGLGKIEHDPLDFGDITLIGRKHLGMPSEEHPIFGQDVWSPRVPHTFDLSEAERERLGAERGFRSLSKTGEVLPETAENLAAAMTKRPIIGGEYLYSPHEDPAPELGYLISSLTPRFKGFEEMSAARNRLVPESQFHSAYKQLQHQHTNLSDALERGRFSLEAGDEDPELRLGKAILFGERRKGSDYSDPAKMFYPNISDPQREWFKEHVQNIRNLPTSYFEAKPQRVVRFEEFGGAAVPENRMEKVSPILKQMGIEKIVPYYPYSMDIRGEGHTEALRQFPEFAFKSGGAPEADMGESKQKDMVSRALDFVSQFNPIGSASAETPPVGVIKQLVGKFTPTVKNLAREEPLYPGVYGNPREMALEAERRVAPEDPALKRLWGVDREDIYNIAGNRPGNMPAVLAPPAAKARGEINYAAEGTMQPENAQRLMDILEEGRSQPGLRRGMMPWYYMDPAYNRLEALFGPDEAKNRFNLLNTSIALMSPSANVKSEINRGLGAYHLALQGKARDFIEHGGNPNLAPEGTIPDYMRGILQGHKTHSTSHGVPFSKYIETGDPGMMSPKVPLYIQSSGVPQTGFQTTLPVPDAHYTRILGMPDVRRTAAPEVSMKMNEYRPIGPWFREEVAKPMGMEAVPAQALLWGTGSGATGVRTAIGAPKLELLSQHIMDAARRHGVSPETARDLILSGTLYARGGSVIQDALDVSSQVSRARDKRGRVGLPGTPDP